MYNRKDTISKAIESVLNQTYKNIEYIVIDGASTDGTPDIIKKFSSHIDVFSSEPDDGIYDALNKGIALSTGDVIGFLHSDDQYANENVISKIAEKFHDNSCDAVYGDLVYTDQEDLNKIHRYWKSNEFEPSLLKKGWMPAHPTLFLKKSVYDKFGKFNTNYEIAADYDFMLRILKSDISTCYIPEVLYKMRTGGVSNRSFKNVLQKSREDYKALKQNNVGGYGTLFLKNFSKLSQLLKKQVDIGRIEGS